MARLPTGQTGGVTDSEAADDADVEVATEQDAKSGRGAHPAAHSGGLIGLAVGAIGIVFGDIGTSPLYAMQTVFSIDGHAVKPTNSDVLRCDLADLLVGDAGRVGEVRRADPAR